MRGGVSAAIGAGRNGLMERRIGSAIVPFKRLLNEDGRSA